MTFKIYKSTDTDAPQLSSTAGSLKSVIKACTVTGYGTGSDEKAPAGFNLVYDEGTKMVIQPVDTGAENLMLRVDNNSLSAYTEMTDIDTGTEAIAVSKYVQAAAEWFMIANAKWFFLFVSTNSEPYVPLFFGNLDNLIPENANKTILINSSSNQYHSRYTYNFFYRTGVVKNSGGGAKFYTGFYTVSGNMPNATDAVWFDIWVTSDSEVLGKLPVLKACTKHLNKQTWDELLPNVVALDMSNNNNNSMQMVLDLS